jgi:hypothetical protein
MKQGQNCCYQIKANVYTDNSALKATEGDNTAPCKNPELATRRQKFLYPDGRKDERGTDHATGPRNPEKNNWGTKLTRTAYLATQPAIALHKVNKKIYRERDGNRRRANPPPISPKTSSKPLITRKPTPPRTADRVAPPRNPQSRGGLARPNRSRDALLPDRTGQETPKPPREKKKVGDGYLVRGARALTRVAAASNPAVRTKVQRPRRCRGIGASWFPRRGDGFRGRRWEGWREKKSAEQRVFLLPLRPTLLSHGRDCLTHWPSLTQSLADAWTRVVRK